MKKLLAVILSFSLVIGCFAFLGLTMNYTPKVSLEEFSAELCEMNRKYKNEPVSNRLIVKSKRNIAVLDSVDIVEGYRDLHIVQFDNSASAKEALEYYNDSKLVEYVEQDFTMSTTEVDYNPHLSWGSESMGTDDYFAYLEGIDNLPEIVVGVIDTGVEIDHEFLKDRIIRTGINYSDSGNSNSENDDNGHGTHCAGIIVDNTLDNVKIEGFKVLSEEGKGSITTIISGIYSAISNHVDVISMSLGGKGHSEAMQDAVNIALGQGITVCASAGNNGGKASDYCPANLDGVITVAAHDAYDNTPLWSNYGDTVDIIAPGVAIESSWLGNTYEIHSGTSMACPHAAAAAALILTNHIDYSPNDILNVLQENGKIANNSFYPEKKILYIGDINNYRERTAMPEFATTPDIYEEQADIVLSCSDNNANIYYTIDGSLPTIDNSILYTGPIHIEEGTVIRAFAYNEDKLKSLLINGEYFIATADSDNSYEIDEDGVITAYNGDSKYLKIPNVIKGITVTGIGYQVFYRSKIVRVFLPDTLKTIGKQAFKYCSNIEKINCKNVECFGFESFRGCNRLESVETNAEFSLDDAAFMSCVVLSHIDFGSIKELGQKTFYNCYVIDGGYNDKLETIPKQALHNCKGILYLDCPNLICVKEDGLSGCLFLETIKADKLNSIDDSAFENDRSLKELNFPELSALNGTNQFYNLSSVTDIRLPKITGKLPDYCFSFINNVTEMVFDGITEIGNRAISNSNVEKVVLKNAVKINDNAFLDSNFDVLYLPKLASVGTGLASPKKIRNLFVPSLKNAGYLSLYSNDYRVFLSDDFVNCKNTSSSYKTGTIIAPADSYAEQWANDNNAIFVDSDSMVNCIGAYKSADKISYEFCWDNIEDIENLADSISYYFETDGEQLEAEKVCSNENGKMYFALTKAVESADEEISVRACVNIDGMVFKSYTITASYNTAESETLPAPENGCEHEWECAYFINGTAVFFCNSCNECCRIAFKSEVSKRNSMLDINNDGIVNGKDYYLFLKSYNSSTTV